MLGLIVFTFKVRYPGSLDPSAFIPLSLQFYLSFRYLGFLPFHWCSKGELLWLPYWERSGLRFLLLLTFTVERKSDCLVSWRGWDEYDRFAEALGATLPRITDGSAESSAAATSKGDTEYLKIMESAAESTEGEKTLIKRSLPGTTAIAKVEMAGLMKMSSIVGRGDGKENQSDYIADVEMVAQLWDATIGQSSNGTDASKITLFHRNLDQNGDAWHG